MTMRPLLIVDDDLPVCLAIAESFEAPRHVIACSDIESAEMILEKTEPSHVLSDVKLTGPFRFEGLDLLDHIRACSPATPVILMTGNSAEGLEKEALNRGVLAVLVKPFSIVELEHLLGPPPASVEHPATMVVPTIDNILASNDMTAKLQPIVSLADERPVGFESLARLSTASPLRDPEILFRYATRKGRVVDLDLACLVRSLETAAPLAQERLLFINMNPAAFKCGDRLTDVMTRTAARFEVPLSHVVIEITEQQQLADTPSVVATIDRLRELGVRFAIDDFGVAYSHLTLITKIRPSFLKVSQEFGTDFEKIAAHEKIVRNVLALARDFEASVILEGIETAATAEAARLLGIPLGQGYYFGRPTDIESLLTVQKRAR